MMYIKIWFKNVYRNIVFNVKILKIILTFKEGLNKFILYGIWYIKV